MSGCLFRGSPISVREFFWCIESGGSLRDGNLKFLCTNRTDPLFDISADPRELAGIATKYPTVPADLSGRRERINSTLLRTRSSHDVVRFIGPDTPSGVNHPKRSTLRSEVGRSEREPALHHVPGSALNSLALSENPSRAMTTGYNSPPSPGISRRWACSRRFSTPGGQ